MAHGECCAKMGQTRLQLKTTIRTNLDDNGVTFYSNDDLNDSIQDAYDDVVCLTQCVPKIADNLRWKPNLVYYNPISDLAISDYLGIIAIFNYSSNRWLRDDLTLRDFDRIQRNWEVWKGTPQFWASSDPLHFAIAPTYGGTAVDGAFSSAFSSSFFISVSDLFATFKLVYYTQAPALSGDSSTFLIASDMQDLVEFYVTADMLEQAQEFGKASDWWSKYYDHIETYASRVKRSNKHDLLLRV